MAAQQAQEEFASTYVAGSDDLTRTLPPGAETVVVGDNLGQGTVDSMATTMVTTMMGGEMSNTMQTEVLDGQAGLDTVSMPTTLLPVPTEYVRLLGQEDLDGLERDIGCTIKVNEPEPGSDAYSFIIYGTKEQRHACHERIEEILTDRQQTAVEYSVPPTDVLPNEALPTGMMGYDANATTYVGGDDRYYSNAPNDGEAYEDNLVASTILPIPKEYVQYLGNLDAIMAQTGCQVVLSQSGDYEDEWQVALFGDPQQRENAHKAIEDSINDALDVQ